MAEPHAFSFARLLAAYRDTPPGCGTTVKGRSPGSRIVAPLPPSRC